MEEGASRMFAVYLTITSLAAALYGMAAIADLIGHDYPESQADKLGVPRSPPGPSSSAWRWPPWPSA
jgi:hypothetical protein